MSPRAASRNAGCPPASGPPPERPGRSDFSRPRSVWAQAHEATASTTTPDVSAAAPRIAPSTPPRKKRAEPAAAIVESRTTVPYATRRVRPAPMRIPCSKRRNPIAAGQGTNHYDGDPRPACHLGRQREHARGAAGGRPEAARSGPSPPSRRRSSEGEGPGPPEARPVPREGGRRGEERHDGGLGDEGERSPTPNAARLRVGSGIRATRAATNGPSIAIISHVAASEARTGDRPLPRRTGRRRSRCPEVAHVRPVRGRHRVTRAADFGQDAGDDRRASRAERPPRRPPRRALPPDERRGDPRPGLGRRGRRLRDRRRVRRPPELRDGRPRPRPRVPRLPRRDPAAARLAVGRRRGARSAVPGSSTPSRPGTWTR